MSTYIWRRTPDRQNLINRYFAFIESLAPSDKLLAKAALLVFLIALFTFALGASESRLVEVPSDGGTLTEGIVGTPRFINPLLAVTNADKDMTALVYAGLMRLGSDGALVPDMAESVTISDDALTYNVVLKDNLAFHDGTRVTAEDIVFTVGRAQDPSLKSPLLSSWEGIGIERVSDREFNFILPEPYAPFIENLTLGILPRHIWETAGSDEFPFSQYNSEPIGSGPYKIERIIRSQSGIPESYELVPYDAKGTIRTIRLNFYPSEDELLDALKSGMIDSVSGLSPEGIREAAALGDVVELYSVPLPRTFALFFNQNEAPVFRDSAVREALSLAVDRNAIIRDALQDNGYPITGPIPPGFGFESGTTTAVAGFAAIEKAKETLSDGGWTFDEEKGRWTKKAGKETLELAFSIATANSDTFGRITEDLKNQWALIGVPVDVKRFEQTDLRQSVIRPRKFETLLFGTVVGRDLDLYSFWHSSQRNDPGLNVALYANISTDSLLEKARTERSLEKRDALYARFESEVGTDVPAIFLYAPAFTYLMPKSVQRVSLEGLAEPYERFSTVRDWFIETDSVWPIFTE